MIFQVVHLTYYSLNRFVYASCGNDCDIIQWDISKNKIIKKLCGHKKAVYSLCYLDKKEINGNGDLLLSGSEDSSIKLWQFTLGLCLLTISDHVNGVNFLFKLDNYILYDEQDSNVCASVSVTLSESSIFLWNIISNKTNYNPINRIVIKNRIRLIDYFFDQSEQSYFIVYSCFSNLIHISDVLNTRKVNFEGHNQLVSSLISLKGFRKIEYYIASGDENGNALIWRTDSRETLYSFSNLHIGWITSISLFSWLNGDFIVTGSSDQTIKILDLNLGDYIKEFRFKKYEISFVAVGGGIENDLSLIFGNFSNIFYLYT